MMKKTQQAWHGPLRAAIYKEENMWLAHCLELDIVAEGKTPHKAFDDLAELCALQIRVALEEGDVRSVFRPAPPEIMQMYFFGKHVKQLRARKAQIPTQEFEAREIALV